MAGINELDKVPHAPGCYLYRDEKNEVIYVGKAKDLNKRVSSYFQKKDHDIKTKFLVENIRDIDFIVTKTEVEALILENTLIKKHYPKYNLDLKDSKRYAYLLLTNTDLPWLETARKKEGRGEYYGPFVSGSIRKTISDLLERQFRILSKKPSPQLKKIIDKEAYLKKVEYARKILSGKVDELINELEKEMNESSKKTYYEHARNLRNQINALKTLKEKQLIEQTNSIDSHIFNYAISGDEVYLLVFSVRKGVLEGKESYQFPYREEFLDEFILRYYDVSTIPQEIILPEKIDDAIEEYLTRKKGAKTEIIIPQKGDKKELLDLVLHNVHATFFGGRDRLIELQKSLELPKLPRRIECFDISHLVGTDTVASMSCFLDGRPAKQEYRKFKIRSQTYGDDFMAMHEVIGRRFKGSLSKDTPLPDLLVIDGGLGQLHAANKVLKELGLKIEIISLAKRLEEIYLPNSSQPIRLHMTNKGLHLLQAIRDEAHRFAISYNRHLRKLRIQTSVKSI